MQRCLLCTNPAVPNRQHCSKHDAMGTAETVMNAEGVIVNLPSREAISAVRDTGPGLTAGNYSPAVSDNNFGPGTTLGEYVVEKKIGEGGMGEVWCAIQPTIGKRVAVKLLNIKVKDDPIQLARFKREALVVNQVKHRHLVDIFSFGELSDKRPYFIMEFLEGETLTSFCAKRSVLPFQEIDTLFGQLCRALQAAHDKGVIHRDLKPDNIFMLAGDDDIFAKILDFGIAKLDDNEDGLTKTGTRFGTPTYMSPEQCRESKDVDARSDIYSLGIILYEIICGRTPFYQKGDPVVRVMIRHQSETPKLPSTIATNRNIPPELDAFILRVLAKEASARPQSCTAFYAELKKVLPKNEATVSELPPVPVVVAPPSKAPSRTPVIAAILGGAALLGVLSANFLAGSKPAEVPSNKAQLIDGLNKLPEPTSVIAASAPTSVPVAVVLEEPKEIPAEIKKAEPKDKTKKKPKATDTKDDNKTAAKPPAEKPPEKINADHSVLSNSPDATLKPKFGTNK
jgi:serine/threonine protein kinase